MSFYINRLIRNSNGLTTIRLISHNNDPNSQEQPMDEYSHGNASDIKSECNSAATDLRKME